MIVDEHLPLLTITSARSTRVSPMCIAPIAMRGPGKEMGGDGNVGSSGLYNQIVQFQHVAGAFCLRFPQSVESELPSVPPQQTRIVSLLAKLLLD